MTHLLSWVLSLSVALTSLALAEDSIVIGVCLPLSGNLGTTGGLILEGIRVAHTLRAQALDLPVELRVVDTRSDPAEEANAVFRLVEKDRAVAIIGGMGAEIVLPGSSSADRRDSSFAAPWASSVLSRGGREGALRVRPFDDDQGKHAASLAVNSLAARTAAIVYDISDERSIAQAAAFRREFARRGCRILLQTRIRSGDRDFTAQINQIKAARPDIVYAPLCYIECALMARQARCVGIDVPTIAGDAVHVREFIEFGGKYVEDLFFTSYFVEGMIHGEQGKSFRDLCKKKTGRPFQAAQALGADIYWLILKAITEAGSAGPMKIREALSALKCFDGVTGKIFLENGSKVIRPVVMARVKGGRFVEWGMGSSTEPAHVQWGEVRWTPLSRQH